MSSIREFYIEKEKRELINTINSAKYISEEQKEAMVSALNESQREIQDLKDQLRDMEQRHGDMDHGSDEEQKMRSRIYKKREAIRQVEKLYRTGMSRHTDMSQFHDRGKHGNE